jgi:hypothetical protein
MHTDIGHAIEAAENEREDVICAVRDPLDGVQISKNRHEDFIYADEDMIYAP